MIHRLASKTNTKSSLNSTRKKKFILQNGKEKFQSSNITHVSLPEQLRFYKKKNFCVFTCLSLLLVTKIPSMLNLLLCLPFRSIFVPTNTLYKIYVSHSDPKSWPFLLTLTLIQNYLLAECVFFTYFLLSHRLSGLQTCTEQSIINYSTIRNDLIFFVGQ